MTYAEMTINADSIEAVLATTFPHVDADHTGFDVHDAEDWNEMTSADTDLDIIVRPFDA